jgi:hypothetical protein
MLSFGCSGSTDKTGDITTTDVASGLDTAIPDIPETDEIEVTDICDKIFECFETAWGWTTEEECRGLFLTGCADEAGYLTCTAACVAGPCSNFDPCEPDCWTAHCEE